MIGSLVALDAILFYVFWEVMLIPMYFIIGIWGGKRRIYATMKFVLFTLAGSLLMFVGDPLRLGRPREDDRHPDVLPPRVDPGRLHRRLGPDRRRRRRSSSGPSPSPSS